MHTFYIALGPLSLAAVFIGYLLYEFRRSRRYVEQARSVGVGTSIPLADELVLVRGQNHVSVRQTRIMQAFGLLLVLIMLGLEYIIVSVKHPDQSPWNLLALEWVRLVQHPGRTLQQLMLAIMMIAVPQLGLAINRYERLILNRDGIRYRSPFRGVLAAIKPDWELTWSEIKKISFNHYLVRGRLVIQPLQGKRRIVIVPAWWRPEDLESLWRLPLYTRLREIRRHRLDTKTLSQSPLLRYCRDIDGVTIDVNVHPELEFDLVKHPLTSAMVVALFVMIVYGGVDLLVDSERYVTFPPIGWFVLGGVGVTLVLGSWLRRQAVPVFNAWLLASLLGTAFGLDMYPGLLRINQLTNQTGLQAVSYRHVSAYRFAPLRQGLPEIVFTPNAYWRSVPANGVVKFMLRHGKLGFYQIDMAPIYTHMRHWDCLRRVGRQHDERAQCDNE